MNAPTDLGFNAAWEWSRTYDRAFKDAMQGGSCVFGKPYAGNALDSRPDYENDQQQDLLEAVRDALRVIGHTPETVGTAVLLAVAKFANAYASDKADEAAEKIREEDGCCDDDEDLEAA